MMTKNGQKTDEGFELRKEIFLKMLEIANTEEEITLLLKNGSIETFKTYEKDEEGKLKVKTSRAKTVLTVSLEDYLEKVYLFLYMLFICLCLFLFQVCLIKVSTWLKRH